MKNKKKMCFGVIIGTRAYFNCTLQIYTPHFYVI